MKYSRLVEFQRDTLVVHVILGILNKLMIFLLPCLIWIKNRNRPRRDFLHVVATTSQAKASYQ